MPSVPASNIILELRLAPVARQCRILFSFLGSQFKHVDCCLCEFVRCWAGLHDRATPGQGPRPAGADVKGFVNRGGGDLVEVLKPRTPGSCHDAIV